MSLQSRFQIASFIGLVGVSFAVAQPTGAFRIDGAGFEDHRQVSEISAAGVLVTLEGQPSQKHVVVAYHDWRPYPNPCAGFYTTRMGVVLTTNGFASWQEYIGSTAIKPTLTFVGGNPTQSTEELEPMSAADPVTGDLYVGGCWYVGGSYTSGLFVARKPAAATQFLSPANVIKDPHNAGFDLSVNFADRCSMTVGRNPTGNSIQDRRVIVTWFQANPNPLVVGGHISWSDDFGQSWTYPQEIPGALPGIGHVPRMGPNGEVYVAFLDADNGMILLQRSIGGFPNWEATPITIAMLLDFWSPGAVGPLAARLPGNAVRGGQYPSIAVNPVNGDLYCAYFDTTRILQTLPPSANADYDLDVYFSKSTNCDEIGPNTCTWSTPKKILTSGISDQLMPVIDVDSTGRIHLAMYDTRGVTQHDWDPTGKYNESYAYSDDGGTTWVRVSVEASHWTLPFDPPCPLGFGDYIGMAVAGTTAYPCWARANSYDTDPNTPSTDDSGDCDIWTRVFGN